MKLLGNIFWFIFGGIFLCAAWAIAGILCCITIIGIPFGMQCFKFAGFVAWPFGKDVVLSSSVGSTIGNIIWILVCGWELAVCSFILGILYCVTIIGIPFGIQSFKFAKLALMPFGAKIIQR